MAAVVCDYCGNKAARVTGREIYPHRPDLYGKRFYQCSPCGAYVGCHPGGDKPLGRLANAELRAAKVRAHAAFDPIWKSGGMNRSKAYAWLAKELGIKPGDCHIGMFTTDMCARVVSVCTKDTTQPGAKGVDK